MRLLIKSRGFDIILEILNCTNWGVIIVISERYKINNKIYHDLIKLGAIIYIGYLENLENVYSYVDCYLFPVIDSYGSIDMPLTVIESIACGTPVLSTYYKSLPRFLNKEDGVFFYDDKNDLIKKLKEISRYKFKCLNPEFLWDNIVRNVENKYFEDK